LVGAILLVELVLVVGLRFAGGASQPTGPAPAPAAGSPITNTEAIGAVLYKSPFVFHMEIAGLILLVAMIGAIVLTLRHKPNVKRQDIASQNARNPATAIDIVKVPSGSYTIPDNAKPKERA